MNENEILSPAQNYACSMVAGFYCESTDEDGWPCREEAFRINSETFRCGKHLPIALDS